MRRGRHRPGLDAVTLAVTLGVVCVRAAAADEVDDPKMARIYQAVPPPAARSTKSAPATTSGPGPAAPVSAPKPATPKAEAKAEAREPVKRAARPPAPKPEPPRVEAAKAEPAHTKAARTEPAKTEPPKSELPKTEPVKVAAAKAQPPSAPPAPAAQPVAAAAPAEAPKPAVAASDVDVAARPSGERETARPTSDGPWPYAPRLKLAYRHFPFARVGGTAASGATSPESFESVSLDLYPMSWYLRVGLSTQFGWESEKFDRSGDYFIAETASVGFQLPGRFTPFVEALAGAGYMRRASADWNLPTAYWQVGVDAGVEIYVAKRVYVSLAAGYLHPGNLFVMQSSLMSVKSDSWSLKFGVGI